MFLPQRSRFCQGKLRTSWVIKGKFRFKNSEGEKCYPYQPTVHYYNRQMTYKGENEINYVISRKQNEKKKNRRQLCNVCYH